MNKMLSWLYQPYKYVVLVILFFLDTVVCSCLAWVCSLFSSRLGGRIAVAWAKVIQWITPMPVRVVGRENIVNGQSYVIVANHQSAYDIVMVYGSLPIDFRWMMKKELRDVPFIGFSCERIGHIFIDRSSPRAAYRSIQEAKAKLVDGTSVFIFPEGHRSGRREMGSFKSGAFKIALELGLPILPVSIRDTYKVMSSGFASLRPGRASLVIHPSIDPADYKKNKEELIEILKKTIESGV